MLSSLPVHCTNVNINYIILLFPNLLRNVIKVINISDAHVLNINMSESLLYYFLALGFCVLERTCFKKNYTRDCMMATYCIRRYKMAFCFLFGIYDIFYNTIFTSRNSLSLELFGQLFGEDIPIFLRKKQRKPNRLVENV